VIARTWGARADAAGAAAYRRHFLEDVLPALSALPGHRGAWLLERQVGAELEILVVTLWDSMEAVGRFASSSDAEAAVVAPEARAALKGFDERVRHYQMTVSSGTAPARP
jgi:heme-degrading monooxygenase HmoA